MTLGVYKPIFKKGGIEGGEDFPFLSRPSFLPSNLGTILIKKLRQNSTLRLAQEGVGMRMKQLNRKLLGLLSIAAFKSVIVSIAIFFILSLYPKPCQGNGATLDPDGIGFWGFPDGTSFLQGREIGFVAWAADGSVWLDSPPAGTSISWDANHMVVCWSSTSALGPQVFNIRALLNGGGTARMKLTYYVIKNRPPYFILNPSELSDNWRADWNGTEFDAQAGVLFRCYAFANDPDEPLDAISNMGCFSPPAGTTCEFHGDDVDGDGLTEGWLQLSWTPTSNDVGSRYITIWAEDAPGYLCDGSTYARGRCYLTIKINVSAHPPTLVTVPSGPFTVKPNNELTFDVIATDSVDNVVGITVENLPNNAIFLGGGGSAPAHGVFTWTPGPGDYRPNPYIVNFTATDEAGNQGHLHVSIQVEDAPPKITTPSNGQSFTWSTDRLWVLSVEATDPDGSVVSITATGQPPGSDFKESTPGSATLSWWPGPGDGGSYPVTFTARDNAGLTDQVSVTIIVDALRFVEPPAGYRYWGQESLTAKYAVGVNVEAVGPPGCTISLAMASPLPPPVLPSLPIETWHWGEERNRDLGTARCCGA